MVDKEIIEDFKSTQNLAVAWIDYRKAYEMVPHTWIAECLKMFGIADNVRSF